MANVIKLRKGLDINLKGKAAKQKFSVKAAAQYALVPDDFVGMTPKVVVREGDKVMQATLSLSTRSRPTSSSPLRLVESCRQLSEATVARYCALSLKLTRISSMSTSVRNRWLRLTATPW